MAISQVGRDKGSEKPRRSEQVDLGGISGSALARASVNSTKSNVLYFYPLFSLCDFLGDSWGSRDRAVAGSVLHSQDHSLLHCSTHLVIRTCHSSFYLPSPAFLQVTLQSTSWDPGVIVKAQEVYNNWGVKMQS